MSRPNLISLCIVGVILASCIFETSEAASANVIEIYRKSIFDGAVLRNRRPVVVFYYSSSECKACKWSLLPMLENLARKKSESIYLAKVDLDKVPELQSEHGIETIPTTMVYFNGDIQNLVEGSSWGRIVQLVNEASNLQ